MLLTQLSYQRSVSADDLFSSFHCAIYVVVVTLSFDFEEIKVVGLALYKFHFVTCCTLQSVADVKAGHWRCPNEGPREPVGHQTYFHIFNRY